MDYQVFINIIVAGVSSILAWFAREMWSAVKELKNDLAKLREEVVREFVTKKDYREDMHDVKTMLEKILDKIDGKVDK